MITIHIPLCLSRLQNNRVIESNTMTKQKFVNSENARRGKYLDVIRKIGKEGVCPFCPEHLRAHHKKPILSTGKHWLVTENMYPYENAKFHFLLIHKKHIESLSEISKDAWAELHRHCKRLLRKYKIPGGTVFLRFGDSRYTGSSVTHLHAQLVCAESGKAVVTRI